jgi:voltage-gated sodium channel
MVQLLSRLAESKALSRIVLTLIVISSVLVGMETYPTFANDTAAGQFVNVAQDVILWLFVVEIVIKIGAHGTRPWRYFRNPWNVFDFIIVAICFLPFDTQFAAVFRIARLLRTVRMLTIVPELQTLVNALLRAIPSLSYVGGLLLLHFYIYAVLGTFSFSANDPIRFGSLHKSMLTLFQVLTLEGWNDVIDTQRYGSDVSYDEEWKQMAGPDRVSTAQPLVAAAYFVSFILVGTMIMLNLFTGVIISSMEDAQASLGRRLTENDGPPGEIPLLTLQEEFALMSRQVREIAEYVQSVKQGQEALAARVEEQVADSVL